ncbi:hypothetical protein [Amylibacter marinus]|nr:hypothetical protein [Amylibacter marinus]
MNTLNGSFAATIVSAFAAIGTKIEAGFEALAAANSCSHISKAMNNMTDADLADKYGINRDQINAYVFRETALS